MFRLYGRDGKAGDGGYRVLRDLLRSTVRRVFSIQCASRDASRLQRLQVQDPLVQANPTAKINTFMAAFKTMDLDGSESLDFNEFLSGLITLGILVDRTKAWDMFRVMDEAHITHCPIDLTGTRLHDLDPPRALGGRLRDAEQRRVR